MRLIYIILGLFLIVSCQKQIEKTAKTDQKTAISKMYRIHVEDLKNLDHAKLMTHYADVDDHILFGDGEYWGNYQTVNDIWKNFIGDTKEILIWNLSNEHINLLSDNSASYLMEYYNERIDNKGDTLKVRGSAGYGLRKIENKWRIVTTNVSHIKVD